MTQLKTISYQDGLVTFRIPSTWKANQEDDGGGEFYDDAPDSPTLRIKYLALSGRPVTNDSVVEVLSSIGPEKAPESLGPGLSMLSYAEAGEENGVPLWITYWVMAQAVVPTEVRIANFSWTILERQKNDPQITQQRELIEREVRAAKISVAKGD